MSGPRVSNASGDIEFVTETSVVCRSVLIDSIGVSLAPDSPQLRLEVGGRALGVDVAGREVELGARRVAGAVHFLAVRRSLVDDAGACEAAVPPAMERRSGERLAAVLPDHRPLRTALLRVEQVLGRVAPEGELSDLLAELLGRNRRVADPAALAVHAEASAAEVEVAVADCGELALEEAHEEEQLERDAITQLGLRGDDPDDVVGREELAFDVAQPRRADRGDRVALELDSACAHLKNDIRTARTFLRVRGAASPQHSSMNARRRVVPSGGSKAASSRSAWSIASLARIAS